MEGNKVIEKRLTTLEVLGERTRTDVAEIKRMVGELREDFNKNNLSNKLWLIGILVAVIALLISTILK